MVRLSFCSDSRQFFPIRLICLLVFLSVFPVRLCFFPSRLSLFLVRLSCVSIRLSFCSDLFSDSPEIFHVRLICLFVSLELVLGAACPWPSVRTRDDWVVFKGPLELFLVCLFFTVRLICFPIRSGFFRSASVFFRFASAFPGSPEFCSDSPEFFLARLICFPVRLSSFFVVRLIFALARRVRVRPSERRSRSFSGCA